MESGRTSGQPQPERRPEAEQGAESAGGNAPCPGTPDDAVGPCTPHSVSHSGTPHDALAASILGTGIDMVHVPSFAEDLARPGSVFASSVFTVGERTAANRRGLAGDALARHLAGRWAVKEAVIKAWSQAIYGAPPVIPRDELDWREIEVVADAWGRVAVTLHGRVRDAVIDCFATPTSSAQERADGASGVDFHVSISHDGDHAIAIAILAR